MRARGAASVEAAARGQRQGAEPGARTVVGAAADDPDLDARLGVPAGEAVKHVEAVQHVEVVDGALAVEDERVLVHLVVGRPLAAVLGPPDVALALGVAHHALVPRGAARLGARQGGQRAGGHDVGALLVGQCQLVELRGHDVVEDHHGLEAAVGDGLDEAARLVQGAGGLGHGHVLRAGAGKARREGGCGEGLKREGRVRGGQESGILLLLRRRRRRRRDGAPWARRGRHGGPGRGPRT